MNFWTLQSKIDFHTAVGQLFALTDTPCSEQIYRGDNQLIEEQDDYTLSFADELQISDNVAFLAQYEEGVKTVSAATLCEGQDGLSILIASNHTPSQTILEGVREIMGFTSQYSLKSTREPLSRKCEESADHFAAINREEFMRKTFDKVVEISRDRILGRIRPPWHKSPAHVTKLRPTLLKQIKLLQQKVQDTVASQDDFVNKINELIKALQVIQISGTNCNLDQMLKTAVLKCVEISNDKTTNSLEDSLKALGAPSSLCQAPQVRQVDKLARYFYICRDLMKIARKPQYQHLLRQIKVDIIESYPGHQPPGAFMECFVHAEMQQVLHWELTNSRLKPRAIGCSKSACFLCNLFILKQKKFRVSCSHGRLFPKWTLPDVDWMDQDSATKFGAVVRSMISALAEEENLWRRSNRQSVFRNAYIAQSRTFLPLSSATTSAIKSRPPSLSSTCSLDSIAISTPPKAQRSEEFQFQSTQIRQRPITLFDLREQDLPFHYCTQKDCPTLSIKLEQIYLIFELPNSLVGDLYIRVVADEGDVKTIEAQDIPTSHGTVVGSLLAPSHSAFRLRHNLLSIEIMFSHRNDLL